MNTKMKTCCKETQPVILNLSLGYNVNSELCCKLVSGIVKHVLYHREQIPEPFDQLLKTCAKLEECKNEKVKSVISSRARQKEIQLCKLGKAFSEFFTNLETIFLNAEKSNVRRIAVILGTTPVNPREIHCIELPAEMGSDQTKKRRLPLVDITTSRRYIAQMFRTLYITSNAVVWPRISPTNIMILLEMKRDCQVEWFLPKSSYSLPERGHTVIYRIDTTVSEVPAPEQNDTNFSNGSGCHNSISEMQFDVYQSPQIRGSIRNHVPTGSDADCSSVINGISDISIAETQIPPESTSDENYIWFQMPVTAKGFVN